MEDTPTLVEHLHSVESLQKRSHLNSVKKTPTSSTSKGWSSSACASRVAYSLLLVLFKAMEYLFQPIMRLLCPITHAFFKIRSMPTNEFMIIQIEEYHGMSTTRNMLFEASELYLHNKKCPSTRLLKITQTQKDTKFAIEFSNKQEFEDIYEGVQLKWKYNSKSKKSKSPSKVRKRQFFELRFDVKHKEKVTEAYLPYVVETSKAMKEGNIVNLHTLVMSDTYRVGWSAIKFKHPATFDTIAMDSEQKRSLLEDLNRFVKRREFYQRVGRAWKKGYLLYGPPGTGKSSLIAAIANYLKFDIYDLQLTHLTSEMELRRVLLATTNKSILVIEDTDSSQLKLQDRKNISQKNDSKISNNQLLLAGLLNFTDGLWSSCGEERIIVYTTNDKSKLDSALLRSGRMDMHIHMSYCSYEGFKTLASNYLGIKEHQPLFDEIKSLLQKTKITPAQVTEELMKSEDADVAVQALITRIKEIKKKEEDEKKAKDEEKFKKDKEKVDPKQLTYFI